MTSPLIIIPVLSAAKSTPRLLTPIRGRSSLERTLDSAVTDLPESKIVVTTDDTDIHEFVEGVGGPISAHRRTSGDYAGALAEVAHLHPSEVVVVLEPTHPFRPRGLIKRTADNLAARGHLDSVVCARRFYANLWRRGRDGQIVALTEGGAARDAEYFQELVGLALATRPHLFDRGQRLGDAVGFELVEQTWALADVRDDTGFAVAEALSDSLTKLGEITA